MRRGDAPWAGRQQHCRPREKSLCAASDGRRSNRQSLAPRAPVAGAIRLVREGGPFSAHASKRPALRKTMQPSEGCALPRKLLPSPPPWTGNSSIIFGSNSNVVFGPPDAPERPRRDSRVGRHRSTEIKRGGRSSSDCHWTARLGNGTDPCGASLPQPATVRGRAYLDDVSCRGCRHLPRNVGRI